MESPKLSMQYRHLSSLSSNGLPHHIFCNYRETIFVFISQYMLLPWNSPYTGLQFHWRSGFHRQIYALPAKAAVSSILICCFSLRIRFSWYRLDFLEGGHSLITGASLLLLAWPATCRFFCDHAGILRLAGGSRFSRRQCSACHTLT